MDDGVIHLTDEQLEDLAAKLDAFGESLPAEQRQALAGLLAGGIDAAAGAAEVEDDEVTGFAMFPATGGPSPVGPQLGFPIKVPGPASFGLLGDSLRLGNAGRPGWIGDKTGRL